MAGWFDLQSQRVLMLVAGTVLVGVSGWVFATGLDRRVTRATALFLFLFGLFMGLGSLSANFLALGDRVRWYIIIALPFAACNLLVAFVARARRVQSAHWKLADAWTPWSLLLAALMCEIAYLLDHSLSAAGDFDNPTHGWLYPTKQLIWSFLSGISLIFALAARSATPGLASGLLRLSLGFLILPAYVPLFINVAYAAFAASGQATWGQLLGAPVDQLMFGIDLSTTSLVVLTAIVADRIARRTHHHARHARLAGIVGATAVVAGIVFSLESLSANAAAWPHYILYGTWTIIFASIVAVPLLRERVLHVDTHVRFAFKGSTAAAALAAMFFVVAEATSNWLGESQGAIVGSLAAGILFVVGRPLMRRLDRRSRDHGPLAEPTKWSAEQRAALYREHVEIAWSDGVMKRKERLLLDQLRDRLGMAITDAADIEKAVVTRSESDPSRRLRHATR